MKAEKNTISGAEALKKLKEITKRIEKEKGELKAELESVEAELKVRASGTTKSSGFDIKDILENDNDETTEKLKNKAKKLKNALNKPNYADIEFRKYSLIYLEPIAEKCDAEVDNWNKKIKALEKEITNLKEEIRNIENHERPKSHFTLTEEARKIGITDFYFPIHMSGKGRFEVYKEECGKYDN